MNTKGHAMGELIEMKRKVSVSVRRFGCDFRVDYRVGRTIELSDPQAALYRDNAFLAWLSIGHSNAQWSEIYLDLNDDLGDDVLLIQPEMLGMNPSTDDVMDVQFILEAQDYLLSLLGNVLGRELVKTIETLPVLESGEVTVTSPRMMHPRERGQRVAETWHNNGQDMGSLPVLVALEVYDAIEGFGFALADEVDERINEDLGVDIRHLVENALIEWRDE